MQHFIKTIEKNFQNFFFVLQIFFPSHFHLVYLCKLSKNGQVSFCSKAIIIFDEYMEDQAQNSLDETDNSCDCILSARFAVFQCSSVCWLSQSLHMKYYQRKKVSETQLGQLSVSFTLLLHVYIEKKIWYLKFFFVYEAKKRVSKPIQTQVLKSQ